MNPFVWWTTTSSLICGFILCAASTALIQKLAIRSGFVDQPGGHKGHDSAVALGGGTAITLAILLPLVAGFALVHLMDPHAPPAWLPEALVRHLPGLASKAPAAIGLAAGALTLHVLGIIDDKRALGAAIKLCVQIAVAAYVALTLNIRILTALGPVLSSAATVLWIVIITNAFNFLDNMDGLCAGVAAITAVIFAAAAVLMHQIFVPTLACLVAGAMCGYLCFNYPPARIFMGDAGSLVIGYFMSILTILTTYWDPELQGTRVGVLIPVVVLAVPLYDVFSVVIIRLRQGASPFRADRRHFSHRLIQRGMSPRTALWTIYLATAATGLGATVLPRVSNPLAYVILLQCMLIVTIIAILESSES